MQIPHTRPFYRSRPGFISILMVLSTGLALLTILLVMHRDTLDSLDAEKKNMLSYDYQQREDAFLRALVNIVPNKTMLCMADNSWNNRANLTWEKSLKEALVLSNAQQALPSSLAGTLGTTTMRKGNSADFTENIDIKKVISPVADSYLTIENNSLVSSGTKKYNTSVTKHYPPHLTETATDKDRQANYPVVSNTKIYDSSVDGWIDKKTSDKRFGVIPLPKKHFRYKEGSTFIAKHNWWTFNINFSAQQKAASKFTTRDKQYIFSIYETPSQLAINGASDTVLGKHESGSAWSSKFNVHGGVFATEVQAKGAFTTSSIASRKNIELKSAVKVGSTNYNQASISGDNQEKYESKGQNLLLTSAGESGRVAFFPINGGEFETSESAKTAAFYDHPGLTIATPDPASYAPGNNAVSKTSWDYYSRGACQCKMRIVYNDSVFFFSFEDNSITDAKTTEFINLPEFAQIFSHKNSVFTINLNNLLTLLTAQGIQPDLSNSLYVKYVGSGSPSIILDNADDMTLASSGFSLVTNRELVIASNINTEGTAIPLSIFSPTTQFGSSNFDNKIKITGQITSIAKQGTSYIGDFKSGDGAVNNGKIFASLTSITDPTDLPPINMMNWMVVIREKLD